MFGWIFWAILNNCAFKNKKIKNLSILTYPKYFEQAFIEKKIQESVNTITYSKYIELFWTGMHWKKIQESFNTITYSKYIELFWTGMHWKKKIQESFNTSLF